MSNLLKISFLSLLLLLSFSAEAQRGKKKKKREPEPIVQKYETPKYKIKVAFDADSLMHGSYEYYFKEKLQAKGQYEHGTKVGDWVYTPDDTIKIVGSYDETGEKIGNWKYYFQNKLIYDLNFIAGELTGKLQTFYQNGPLSVEDNELKDSTYTTFYINGNPKERIELKKDRLIGRFTQYKQDGSIINDVEYKNGYPYHFKKLNQQVLKDNFFFGGTLFNGNGSFIISKKIDKDSTWIKYEMNFADGLPHGNYYRNDWRGKKSVKGQFENGFMSGTWVKYPNSDNQSNPIIKNYALGDKIESDTLFISYNATDFVVPAISEELQPYFPGGDKAMMSFLGMEVGYPRLAREYACEGTVFMRFVVESDGSISNIETVKILGFIVTQDNKAQQKTAAELEKEVHQQVQTACTNAIKRLPYFRPAFQYGMPVRVRMVVPLKFKMN